MAPITGSMGSFEVAFEAEDGEEREVLTFEFFAPLSEGGKAMVRVNGRDTVMGVEVDDVEEILHDLEDLRPDPPEDPVADSE